MVFLFFRPPSLISSDKVTRNIEKKRRGLKADSQYRFLRRDMRLETPAMSCDRDTRSTIFLLVCDILMQCIYYARASRVETALPYWPTLPFFPGKSRKINTPPGVPGISSKLREKPQFCRIQDFPENSMDSPRMSRFFELF